MVQRKQWWKWLLDKYINPAKGNTFQKKMLVFGKAAAISSSAKWTLQRISSPGNWIPLFIQRKMTWGQYKASFATNTSYCWAHEPLGRGRRGTRPPLCWGCGQPELAVPLVLPSGHIPSVRDLVPTLWGLAHVWLLTAHFGYNQHLVTCGELTRPWLPKTRLAAVQCCGGWCRGQAALSCCDALAVAAAAAEKPALAFLKREGSSFAHQVLIMGIPYKPYPCCCSVWIRELSPRAPEPALAEALLLFSASLGHVPSAVSAWSHGLQLHFTNCFWEVWSSFTVSL